MRKVLLPLLLALCIARLWLMPLTSSFWVDEMGTMFVVEQGAHHASFADAPQVPASIYYGFPRASQAALDLVSPLKSRPEGITELAYRIPSVIAMALALWLIARLAARLIHPEAGWLAAFACLSLRGINYQADDARPYALGTLVAAAAVFYLVRWLDTNRWSDASLFLLLGALLWRVHLLYWPFYVVFAIYAAWRLVRSETAVGWRAMLMVFAVLGAALIPVAFFAAGLLRGAKAHVIVPVPSPRDLSAALKFGVIAICGGGAWLLSRLDSRQAEVRAIPAASAVLIFGWWLAQPLGLFAFSHITGNSVFVTRYLSLALPGAALTAILVAEKWMPAQHWNRAAAAMGVGVLALLGQWRTVVPPHHNSDWRGAARAINALALRPETPVLCTSPFIEARPPVWRPSYVLPGFLYAQLAAYPIGGHPVLLPFESSKEAELFAVDLTKGMLKEGPRFLLYGSAYSLRFWTLWFAQRPEMKGWSHHSLGSFGDIEVVTFERTAANPV